MDGSRKCEERPAANEAALCVLLEGDGCQLLDGGRGAGRKERREEVEAACCRGCAVVMCNLLLLCLPSLFLSFFLPLFHSGRVY